MPPKTIQIYEGEWIDWNRRETWECCGCALVHKVQVRKCKGGRLQIRMFTDNRKTAQRRRAAGVKLKRKK